MDLHVGRPLSASEIEALLSEAREHTLMIVGPVSDADARLQHDPLMSPIVWDLGHIGHFEDVWLIEKLEDGAGDSEGLLGMFDPFEHPRATRDGLPLPSLPECRRYLDDVRARALRRLHAQTPDASDPLLRDGFVYRLVLQHEYLHCETILQTLQLKRGRPYAPPRRAAPPARRPDIPPPGSMVRFPGGDVALGTDDRSVSYDNERPRHHVVLAPFHIDVHPVTNQQYADFVDDDGYARRDVWSEAGWAWKQEAGLRAPAYWMADGADGGRTTRFMDRVVPLPLDHPVCHVCYWEADAFARWAGKRLPTETEWEVAASWEPSGAARAFPWGDEAAGPGRANLDALVFGTTPVGSYGAGVSALGCWDMIGNVWEWTSSDLARYPGYATFPYPEYSEVFFGDEYKVLRGGSWATRFGAIRNTFRNWDYPIRRQIFSGVRCARDD